MPAVTPTPTVYPHGDYGASTRKCLICHTIRMPQPLSSDELCLKCHATATHLIPRLKSKVPCVDCHEPHGSTQNLALIRPVINGVRIVYRQPTGPDSLSGRTDDPDALCVVCHTQTKFHRPGARKGHFDGQDCTRCHRHTWGFWPLKVQCYECHSTPPPTGDHLLHADASFGPLLRFTCEACHQRVTTWLVHRDGRVEFADHKRLAETTACDECHGAGASQAKALWGSGRRLDCLSCHNATRPARIRGVTAPPVGAYWTVSGHGNTTGFLSGNPGAGLTCETCHDPDAPHITGRLGDELRLRDDPNALCRSCHGPEGSATVKVSTHGNVHFGLRFEAPFQVGCVDCHDPHGTANLFMIRSEIRGNPVVFTALTGPDSFDEPDDDNRDDLCATCHTQTDHNRNPANTAEQRHFEGANCTNCHTHDRDEDPTTVDGFVLGGIGCNFCHGQPPPPASRGYPLDEARTPHQLHASEDGYGFGCQRCHDTQNPAYAGHRTDPPSFQDVWFDGFNPEGAYNAQARTCSGLYCHSNGDPAGDAPLEYRPMVWGEDVRLTCNGCHGDAETLATNAHAKHLLPQYRERGATSIGCYECHALTAADDANDTVAQRRNHVDRVKQVQIDETDLWGDPGHAVFDPQTLTCSGSRCHSDGAASRAFPSEPTYATPVWTDPASGACGTCHGVTKDTLTTGIHPKHLTFATCTTCHAPYGPAHVNGRVDFADGNPWPDTKVCARCHRAQGVELQPAAPSVGSGTPPATTTTPTPTAVPTPTPTPVPTATTPPTPTPTPTPEPTPSATPIPTPTPEPTPPRPHPIPSRVPVRTPLPPPAVPLPPRPER